MPQHDDFQFLEPVRLKAQGDECSDGPIRMLDWFLIVNARHLERALTVFVDHYNRHRPHRSVDLSTPNGRESTETWNATQPIIVNRRDRLGGLLHEYERAA